MARNNYAGMLRLITNNGEISNYFDTESSARSAATWMNGQGYKEITYVNEEGPDTLICTYCGGRFYAPEVDGLPS